MFLAQQMDGATNLQSRSDINGWCCQGEGRWGKVNAQGHANKCDNIMSRRDAYEHCKFVSLHHFFVNFKNFWLIALVNYN